MSGSRILIAVSNENTRKQIGALLGKKGYQVYLASESTGAIRLARTLYPDLVLMDVSLWGQNAFDAARIIENDGVSSVIMISAQLTLDFFEKLKERKLYAYLRKPIQPEELYRTVDFAIRNLEIFKGYTSKIARLEAELAGRKTIDAAKALLMSTQNIDEEEAYQRIRRESMNLSLTMQEIAKRILKQSE